MKKLKHSALILVLALCAILPAPAQAPNSNPLGLDGTCYALYKEAEKQIGKAGFTPANELFRQAAIEKKDDNALVLYYVEILKDLVARPGTDDSEIDDARENVKRIASEKNQKYYFYQAYQLSQEFYTSRGETYHAMLLMQEMQQAAIQDGDPYGLWISSKYLADMYIRQNDYISAKPHIVSALRLYRSTNDKAIKAESPTRLYCDLADTYPIASYPMAQVPDASLVDPVLDWMKAKGYLTVEVSYDPQTGELTL